MSEQKLRPAKRLKNWHRKYGGGMSLRAYARAYLTLESDHLHAENSKIAKLWLTSKGLLP